MKFNESEELDKMAGDFYPPEDPEEDTDFTKEQVELDLLEEAQNNDNSNIN